MVADEVKALSNRTKETADQISIIMNSLSKRINDLTSSAAKTAQLVNLARDQATVSLIKADLMV